jgi:RNA polymerase sigma factor for flagellar operon FliA
MDDLVSSGVVGLISAIDCFDATLECRIRGAILDNLRGLDWAPRRQRKRAKQIEAAISLAQQRLCRTPTEDEIAQQLGLTLDEYHEWLVDVPGLKLESLERPAPEAGFSRDRVRDISGGQNELPSRLLERSELQKLVAEAISQMPEIEKTVLSLFYFEEITLREISRIVDLCEARVYQLKAQALLRLRSYLEQCWPSRRDLTTGRELLRRKRLKGLPILAGSAKRLDRRPAGIM